MASKEAFMRRNKKKNDMDMNKAMPMDKKGMPMDKKDAAMHEKMHGKHK